MLHFTVCCLPDSAVTWLLFPAAWQAKESGSQVNVVIDKEDVLTKIGDLLKKQDLSRYVL